MKLIAVLVLTVAHAQMLSSNSLQIDDTPHVLYHACLSQYHALPWYKRMWYRRDGNCKRYLHQNY